MVLRVKTWEHETKKGKPGRFRESNKLGNHRVRSAPRNNNSEHVHSVAPNKLSSGIKVRLREATSAKGTNLAQESESAEESTKQVLMGKSRKQSLVLRVLEPR